MPFFVGDHFASRSFGPPLGEKSTSISRVPGVTLALSFHSFLSCG